MAGLSYDQLLQNLIRQESGGKANALSHAGAAGVMQVMPGTAREIAAEIGDNSLQGMNDQQIQQALMDPARGRRYGEHYLQKMLNRYGGDQAAALVAYNGGRGRADAWLKNGRNDAVLPKETSGYYRSILGEDVMLGGAGPASLPGGGGADAGMTGGGAAGSPFEGASDRQKWATWASALGQAFRGRDNTEAMQRLSALEGQGVDQNKTYQALVKRGIDPATAEWAVRDPVVMREVAQQLFSPASSKAMTIETIFDPTTGQEQKVLFDKDTGQYTPLGGQKASGDAISPIEQKRLDQADERIKLQRESLQQAAQSKRTRQLSVNDVEKLSKTGGELQQVQGFGKSFQDKYGGFNPWGDETRLSLGRMGMASADTNDAAGWWQGYDRYKNVVRNELFGASLTPGEQQAFEKSDITPSMSPKAIKDNLKLQSKIVKRGVMARAKALVAAGYDPAPLAEAFGVPLAEITAGVPSAGGGPEPGAVEDGWRFKGGDPADRNNWEQVQ